MTRRVVDTYGPDPFQVGEWFLPDSVNPPLVILVHGGYFRPVWRRSLEEPTALDLAAHGFAVFNIEYRTYENPWPATLLDVGAAVDHAVSHAVDHGIDASRLGICGHSAGGGLTAWVTSRQRLPEDAPGANPQAPEFDIVIIHAGVTCWSLASTEHLGQGAVDTLMGGRPEDVPDRYRACDPCLLEPDPAGSRILLHGDADEDVPMIQSETYLAHLEQHGRPAELIMLPGEGHYEILDASSSVSALRRELLATALHLGTS